MNRGLKLAGDWDLWRRFAMLQELVHVDRQLGSFHARPGQKSADVSGYRKECESIRPSASRRQALSRLLRGPTDWNVRRIAFSGTEELRLRHDIVEIKSSERLKALFRPQDYLLKKLRQRHRAARGSNHE